jgi:septal ring factor EnvC (AmiA/AmiB activator)
MSTDSADEFEWTSPAERTEGRGDVEHDNGGTGGDVVAAVDARPESEDLPPKPVLAARLDDLRDERDTLRTERDDLRTERDDLLTERNALRTERDALESQLDATRQKYERMLAARNDEIAALRRDADPSLRERVRAWLSP